MKKLKERIKSDKAALNSVEIIILISLGVFAALALFTGVLKPTEDTSKAVGNEITGLGEKATGAMIGEFD